MHNRRLTLWGAFILVGGTGTRDCEIITAGKINYAKFPEFGEKLRQFRVMWICQFSLPPFAHKIC